MRKTHMTIKDLEETVLRSEEQRLSHLVLRYEVTSKWKWRGQLSVRTPLGLARIIGSSYTERYIVVALPLTTAKSYINRLKGKQTNGS